MIVEFITSHDSVKPALENMIPYLSENLEPYAGAIAIAPELRADETSILQRAIQLEPHKPEIAKAMESGIPVILVNAGMAMVKNYRDKHLPVYLIAVTEIALGSFYPDITVLLKRAEDSSKDFEQIMQALKLRSVVIEVPEVIDDSWLEQLPMLMAELDTPEEPAPLEVVYSGKPCRIALNLLDVNDEPAWPDSLELLSPSAIPCLVTRNGELMKLASLHEVEAGDILTRSGKDGSDETKWLVESKTLVESDDDGLLLDDRTMLSLHIKHGETTDDLVITAGETLHGVNADTGVVSKITAKDVLAGDWVINHNEPEDIRPWEIVGITLTLPEADEVGVVYEHEGLEHLMLIDKAERLEVELKDRFKPMRASKLAGRMVRLWDDSDTAVKVVKTINTSKKSLTIMLRSAGGIERIAEVEAHNAANKVVEDGKMVVTQYAYLKEGDSVRLEQSKTSEASVIVKIS